MINNRQGGRRRGRGGQRQGGGGQPGNRQDSRQRGNAAQLLEKYKSMARDSQLSGDRVQTEYYLQFADHYFRVLNENKSKFDDPRRQRGDDMDDEEGDDSDLDMMDSDGTDDGDERDERAARQPERAERPARREQRPRRGEAAGDSRRDSAGRANGAGDAMPFDALPPAIGAEAGEQRLIDDEGGEEVARPRRRARAARPADGDDEIAPAA